ncbi:MAG: IS200/IS605 family transposase [Bacteroidia bacterium]|jgi:putative transposase
MFKTRIFHMVFTTKYRASTLSIEVIDFLRDYFDARIQEQGFELLACNGHENHIHLLLRAEQFVDIPKLIGLLKGGAAYKYNSKNKEQPRLRWGVKYYCQMVPLWRMNQLIQYIENQQIHHGGFNPMA